MRHFFHKEEQMKKSIKTKFAVLLAAVLLLTVAAFCACDLFGGGKLEVTFDESHNVFEGDSLESLKPYLTVKYTNKEGATTVTDYTLSGTLQSGESEITVTYEGVSQKIKINVQEKPTEYTVTFVADGQTVGTQKYTVENKNITEPQVPAKEGYTGMWEDYTLTTGDVTVNAVYAANQYTVTFKADDVVVDTCTYTVEEKNVTVPQVPAKTGYTGAWEEYSLTTGNVTVNAVYTAKQYSVTLDYNGATIGNAQTTVTVTYNQPVGALPEPTRKNYDFVGWYWGNAQITADTVWKDNVEGADFVASWLGILEYKLNSDGQTYRVAGIGAVTDTDLTIPAIYKDKPVTSIGGYAFQNCNSFTSITVGNNVNEICSYAFSGCSALTEVTIQDSVKLIDEYAFYTCKSLTNVTIGNGVVTIGVAAFRGCANLTSATLGSSVETIGSHAFYNCGSIQSVSLGENVKSIGKYAFGSCPRLTNILLPSGVTTLDDGAFAACISLTSVIIPGSLSYWGTNVFSGCTGLTSVVLSNGVWSVGVSAFDNCSRLTSMVIPASVLEVGDYAFRGCSKMETVYYAGTANDWTKVNFGLYSGAVTSAARYYYSETEPALNIDGTAYDGNYWHYVDGKATIWQKS